MADTDGIWVDTPKQELPPVASWPTLTLSQLSDLKVQMLDKVYMARAYPHIQRSMMASIAKIDAIIASKMNDR